MGYHIYAIGKAIRALFADRVTNIVHSSPFVKSCVSIKHQLSLARVGDFSDKNGMGISPDPFGGGAYNL